MSSRRLAPAPSSIDPARERACRILKLLSAGLALAALGVGGCAQSPQQIAAASHGKEYFPESVYGRASRRVIADGQPIPHGGGQYLVGKPYTVAGQTYYPSERRIVQVGSASWYGDAFHGRLTANGEIYDRDGFTAAHPTMPLPSYARVTNLRNHYSMIVRVNDRGPYASDRIMDVSRRVAEALDFKRYGTARIKVEYVGRASLAGSDDAKLYATLRTDGPARWGGDGEPTMVAQAEPPAHVASLAPVAMPERRRRFEDDESVGAPPRRVAPILVREPSPEPPQRAVERPLAVEAAYRRYGVVREIPPPRPRVVARFAEPARETFVMPRVVEPPRREDMRGMRYAEHDVAPHLPMRELLPAPRFVRFEMPLRERGSAGRILVPPSRPHDLGDRGLPQRHVVAARSTRYRDD